VKLLERLNEIWLGVDRPFLIQDSKSFKYSELTSAPLVDLSPVMPGDVVAVIGDFDPSSIVALLRLTDLGAIIVPLTKETASDHEYFFKSACVNVVVRDGKIQKRENQRRHELIDRLRAQNRAGLVLFSTGTTGRPKAILHDLTLFLKRFETPRPAFRTINFLLFDHIGGINTVFHTLFNLGVVVAPQARTVDAVLETCRKYDVEVLPTTPTFLRMMLLSGAVPRKVPASLKVITYGTERMDQNTLSELCRLLPAVDFRQTFGMSELGIVRVKSEARDSLFMKIGGEGVETKVVDGVLHIRSETRMQGYLNAASPFDAEGWYDTRDVVEEKDGYYRITGRTTDVINVGGLKFMASEVERVALEFPGVSLVKVSPKQNPFTGQHVELTVEAGEGSTVDKGALMEFLKVRLLPHMVPKRIHIERVGIGHRFKRA
jgi:long-chain acyl-CoA synthetase